MAPKAPTMPKQFGSEATDPFQGVTIRLNEDEMKLTPQAFKDKLDKALAVYKGAGKRGIWIQLSEAAAEFVPIAVKSGFKFHHAVNGNIMLTNWLPTDEESTLPLYPHHQIGVGGMVLNSKGEVLNIQEKMGVTVKMRDFWKLPGGLVDPKEDIQAACVREVFEETGVKTVFKKIAAFRETHQGPFGTTDLYMVCAMGLDPEVYKDGEIPVPTPQEKEIAKAEWRPLEGFLGHPAYAKGGFGDMMRSAAETCLDLLRGESGVGMGAVLKKGFGGSMESMYFSGQGEKRTDPEDGEVLSWDQLEKKYKGKYNMDELAGYWDRDMTPAPPSKL